MGLKRKPKRRKTKADLEREIRRLESENKRLAATAGEFKGKYLDELRAAEKSNERISGIRNYIEMRRRGLQRLVQSGTLDHETMMHKTMSQDEIDGFLLDLQAEFDKSHPAQYSVAVSMDVRKEDDEQ